MRAVVLTAAGAVATVEDWPEPECGPDEVLVGVEGVGLCGSDLSMAAGHRAVPGTPWLLGHEAFGRVVAVGAAVAGRQVGQRVVLEPNYPCLDCPACLSGASSGCPNRRSVGLNVPGALAERIAVPARFAWPVPESLDPADVVCVEPLSVALGAATAGEVGPGEACLVVGAGAQGQLTCLAVQAVGGVPYVTEPHDGRLALALDLGARADTGDRGYPVVIETSGSPEAFAAAVDRVRPGGRLVVVGQSERPAAVSTFTLVQRRLTVRGCLIYDHPRGFAQTLALLAERDLRPGRVLRARYDAADAATAFARASDIPGKSWITFKEHAP